METIEKKDIERHIRKRLEEITYPVNFSYGFMTRPEAESRLYELSILATAFGLYPLIDEIRAAREPISEWIENQRSRGRSIF